MFCDIFMIKNQWRKIPNRTKHSLLLFWSWFNFLICCQYSYECHSNCSSSRISIDSRKYMKLLHERMRYTSFSLEYPHRCLFYCFIYTNKPSWQTPFSYVRDFVSLYNQQTKLSIYDFKNCYIRYDTQQVHSASSVYKIQLYDYILSILRVNIDTNYCRVVFYLYLPTDTIVINS